MYPYLNLGPVHLGTFGLLLWLAAVAATIMLHKNFVRKGVNADALSVVAFTVVAGIIGAKAWHELQNVAELRAAMAQVVAPGLGHPLDILVGFLHWFQAGFAWFGGLVAGIAVLLWQGWQAKPEGTQGWAAAVSMLDLAAPAAALGYGAGRIGCLLSGDGDYGVNTKLPWGVHMAKDALVPPNPPNALVQPTPVYELLFGIVLAWLLWQLGRKYRPVGWLTGVYLVLSGLGRFLVEFVRINPKLYWGMSNAQVAALGSVAVGALVILVAASRKTVWSSVSPRSEEIPSQH